MPRLYRPGNGLNIEAADKSWGYGSPIETHFRYTLKRPRPDRPLPGRDDGRRFSPEFFYCVNNCLWETEATLDLDGWGTGNGKNIRAPASVRSCSAVRSNFTPRIQPMVAHRAVRHGSVERQGGSLARQGSGNVGAQAEYDLLTRNNGFNTGRAGSGIVLNWDDRSLSSIGIPGRIGRFQFGMSSIAEGDDGTQSFRPQRLQYLHEIQPFSQVKNKWISGLTLEYGAWFCNIDKPVVQRLVAVTGQDHGDGGRQTCSTPALTPWAMGCM